MALHIGPLSPVQLEIEFDLPPRYTGPVLTSMQIRGKGSKAFDAGARDCALGIRDRGQGIEYDDGWLTMMAHICFPPLDGKPVHHLYNEAYRIARCRENWRIPV